MDRFSKYCKVISGYAFKAKDLMEEGDIPVIKIGNISNGGNVNISSNTQYVDKSFLSLDTKYHVKNRDILISLTGSHMNQPNSMVGRSCRSYNKETYLLNQRAGKVIPYDIADKDYLYCLLSSEEIKYSIVIRAYGAANQVNISPSDIERIKWDFPEYDIQCKIGKILCTYDDLIEKNNRKIEILQEMAEELYKEWFVRFRFPGYKTAKFIDGIPEGWQEKEAKEIFDITIGRTPSRAKFDYFTGERENNYSWISISDMRNKTFVSDTKEYLTKDAIKACNMPMVEPNTVLLSFKLTVGQVTITTEKTSTNEAIAHFNTKNNILREYTYLYLKNFNYDKLGNTSAIGNAINSTIVKNMKFILPADDILLKFNAIAGNIFDSILSLTKQNENLKTQRDLLLPRLMSGKLEVKVS